MKEHNITVEFDVKEHEILNEALLHLEDSFDSIFEMIDLNYDQRNSIMNKRSEIYDLRKKILNLWVDRFERITDRPI